MNTTLCFIVSEPAGPTHQPSTLSSNFSLLIFVVDLSFSFFDLSLFLFPFFFSFFLSLSLSTFQFYFFLSHARRILFIRFNKGLARRRP